jgi:hypothetical protein
LACSRAGYLPTDWPHPTFQGGAVTSRIGLLIGIVFLTVASARSASAQVQYGPHLNWASNGIGFGVGGRVEASLSKAIPGAKGLGVMGAFNLYFPSGGTAWGIDANATYHFDIPTMKTVAPYVGAGLAILHGVSRTGGGLNIFGGAQFPGMHTITPFGELRLVFVRGTSAFVLTGGVLF